MGVIWTSKTRTKQPSGLVIPNPEFQNRLYSLRNLTQPFAPNAVTGTPIAAATGGVSSVLALNLSGISFTATSDALTLPSTEADSGGGDFSVLVVGGATTGSYSFAGSSRTGDLLTWGHSSTNLLFTVISVADINSSITVSNGKQHAIIYSYRRGVGVTFTLFEPLAGRFVQETVSNTATNSGGSSSSYIGGRNLDFGWNAPLFAEARWKRALSPSEAAALVRNPWQLFAPEKRPLFFSTPGGANNTGTLAVTLDAATLTGVGGVARSGTLATTLDAATLTGVGNVTRSGTLAVTLDAATLSGTGAVTTSGTLAVTLDDATLAGVGSVAVGTNRDGALAVTLDDATLAGVGGVTRSGTLAVTLDNVTLVGIGTAGQAITGTLAVTLDNATLSGVGVIPAAPSTGGGKTTGKNLSRKQKKKLKAVESQEWLKAEETARQLLSDRFTKQTPQEKAQALETYIESLQPVIEALKALTSQIEEVVEEAPVIELTPHQEVIQRFDRLEKKVKSVEELIIILMADL